MKAIVSKRPAVSNGRTPDRKAAMEVMAEVRAEIKKHGWKRRGLSLRQIVAAAKKTRYELFEKEFAPRSR